VQVLEIKELLKAELLDTSVVWYSSGFIFDVLMELHSISLKNCPVVTFNR
jgi:hypothetical protein